MTVTAIGQVFLDGIQFTTDPRTYEPVWPKRQSIHGGLQGAVTVQDFGVFAKDQRLRLESGGQWLTRTVVDALDARFQTRGAAYPFKDWVGTEATVFIVAFDPIDARLGGDLYEYRMELRVLALTKVRGVAYVGS